jgi:hypothetical protein
LILVASHSESTIAENRTFVAEMRRHPLPLNPSK